VGPRTGVDDVEKIKFLTILGLELRPLGRPARSQSLYQLRYPGSFWGGTIGQILADVPGGLGLTPPQETN
jgi:hypothetical protein